MSSYSFSFRRALCALGLLALSAQAALAGSTNVGVSVSVAQPGFYGRVDIGRFPAPTLIGPKAVIAPVPVLPGAPRVVVGPAPEPMYLWVPSGHRGNWARYCGQYHACGRPVYFVRDDWYRDKVMVHKMPPGQAKKLEREHEDHDHEHGHDKDKGKDKDDHGHGKH